MSLFFCLAINMNTLVVYLLLLGCSDGSSCTESYHAVALPTFLVDSTEHLDFSWSVVYNFIVTRLLSFTTDNFAMKSKV